MAVDMGSSSDGQRRWAVAIVVIVVIGVGASASVEVKVVWVHDRENTRDRDMDFPANVRFGITLPRLSWPTKYHQSSFTARG